MYNLFNKIFALIVLLVICLSLNAQTLDEIITRHINAHGGKEKWAEVQDMKLEGNFTSFSLESDFIAFKTADGKYFADLHLGEMKVVEAFDGKEGWTIDPWQEIEFPRKLNKAEKNVFLQKADFFTPFYKYKEKGIEVEYSGKDTIDGLELFKLIVQRGNANSETWYLKTDDYLEYLSTSNWVDFAFPAPGETFFDDFREVDGLILPFFIERTFFQRDHILQLENVTINPDYDKSIYIEPGRKEMQQLAFLIGDWDVETATWTQRGSWYELGTYHSKIEYASKNLIRENISYERIFPINKSLDFTYDQEEGKYLIRVFNDLPSTQQFFTGILSDTIFVFDNTEIQIGEENKESKSYIQYSISNLVENAFTLVISNSTDAENWNPVDRFIYTRKKSSK